VLCRFYFPENRFREGAGGAREIRTLITVYSALGPSNQSDRTESPTKFSGKREYRLSSQENSRGKRPALTEAGMRENLVQSQKAAKWRAFCEIEARTSRDRTGWLSPEDSNSRIPMRTRLRQSHITFWEQNMGHWFDQSARWTTQWIYSSVSKARLQKTGII
jgi:uncharacterized protein (DUF2235 family)